jgi:hypothetical protein
MTRRSLRLAPLLLAACVTAPADRDPSQGQVPLESGSDWNATLALDTGGPGVWTVEPLQVFGQYASPELLALDDQGRCHVLVSYSGKWADRTTVNDGQWLGALAHADVDESIDGAEVYVAGKSGDVYQVIPNREGEVGSRLIANLDAREVHTLVAGDLIPWDEGNELVAFTAPGGLYLLTEWGGGEFDVEHVSELNGRVRDSVLLPAEDGEAPRIVTVSRDGVLAVLQWTNNGPKWTRIHELPMGMGRVVCRLNNGELTIYNTCDDGTIWSHTESAGGGYSHEMIYAGPQGPRGIALGRFHDDDRESVAVFGYSGRVELLTNGFGGWSVETLFTDRDKGHWLAAGEFDGRNSTDELILAGYGARVVLLSRPPGFGLGGVLTEPGPEPTEARENAPES